MTEKIKTGLCILALLLSLLAAYTQEMTYRSHPADRTAVQPVPFTAVRVR